MSRRRVTAVLLGPVLAALAWPAAAPANHTVTQGTVSARVTAQVSEDVWAVEIRWTAQCYNAKPGTEWYEGSLYLIDVETGEREYVIGIVDTSEQASVMGRYTTHVASEDRARHLVPELNIGCYENYPLEGGPDTRATGAAVIIPARFGGGGGGGSGGGGGGGGGGGPNESLGPNGCKTALIGTNRADTLTGTDGGDIAIGFGADDRIAGRDGHDCLIGGSGKDRLIGEGGSDRLTAGSGNDVLVDAEGVNAYNAGSGRDYVNARNGARELVRCGSGRDRARVDRRDRVRGCERVIRPG